MSKTISLLNQAQGQLHHTGKYSMAVSKGAPSHCAETTPAAPRDKKPGQISSIRSQCLIGFTFITLMAAILGLYMKFSRVSQDYKNEQKTSLAALTRIEQLLNDNSRTMNERNKDIKKITTDMENMQTQNLGHSAKIDQLTDQLQKHASSIEHLRLDEQSVVSKVTELETKLNAKIIPAAQ